MPRHWIIAGVIVVAVAVGVVAYAAVTDDGSPDSVASTATTETAVPSSSTTSLAVSSTSNTLASTTTTTAAVTATTRDDAATEPGGCPPPIGSTEAADTGLGGDFAVMSDVEVRALDDCTDVVEFSFDAAGGAPGLRAAYVEPPLVADPSGLPVEVEGDAFLEVTFEPASTFDFEAGEPGYDGPRTLTSSDTVYVRGVANAGDFEGLLVWVVGLDEVRPFVLAVEPGRAEITFT